MRQSALPGGEHGMDDAAVRCPIPVQILWMEEVAEQAFVTGPEIGGWCGYRISP